MNRNARMFCPLPLSRCCPSRLCVAVGIPGGGRGPGFPTVVGRSGGGWLVVRSFPHPVSFHSLGGGKPRHAQAARRRRGSRVRGCGQVCLAASRSARRSACGSRRAACGPACGSARSILRPPPPLRPLRIGSLANGEHRDRNETSRDCQDGISSGMVSIWYLRARPVYRAAPVSD